MKEKTGIEPAGKGSKSLETKSTRRDFLKKAAYTAPGLMILGQLSRPARSSADDFGGPPSDPHFPGN